MLTERMQSKLYFRIEFCEEVSNLAYIQIIIDGHIRQCDVTGYPAY